MAKSKAKEPHGPDHAQDAAKRPRKPPHHERDVCTDSVDSGSVADNDGQGFDALLEPFYQGKSLTDPIDTAKVSLEPDHLRLSAI